MTFDVHEQLARAWVADLIVSTEMAEDFDVEQPSRASPPIGLAWRPTVIGEEDAVALLIRAAQAEGIMARPRRAALDAEFVDDGDEGYYRFFLVLTSPVPLMLAAKPCSAQHPARGATGAIDAALRTLLVAAENGKRLYCQLAALLDASANGRTSGEDDD
jgi:hypothetical protein